MATRPALRTFCSYVSNPEYGWDRVCEQLFGTHPAQVCFEWNTAQHVQTSESGPDKRAFTKRELQDFFDRADEETAHITALGRKGWLPAFRDAVLFKVAYAWGLRRNEVRHLQTVDFSRNPPRTRVRSVRGATRPLRQGDARITTEAPKRVDRV